MTPTDVLLVRIDRTQLYPPFVMRLRSMLAEGMAEGNQYWAISGYRSAAEQERLYAIGRTTPGTKVTNARALESMHNYGLAVDLCRDAIVARSGLQPDWRKESYAPLGVLAKKHSLTWGGTFENFDGPHVQWSLRSVQLETSKLKELYTKRGGLTGVWSYLDSLNNLERND